MKYSGKMEKLSKTMEWVKKVSDATIKGDITTTEHLLNGILFVASTMDSPDMNEEIKEIKQILDLSCGLSSLEEINNAHELSCGMLESAYNRGTVALSAEFDEMLIKADEYAENANEDELSAVNILKAIIEVKNPGIDTFFKYIEAQKKFIEKREACRASNENWNSCGKCDNEICEMDFPPDVRCERNDKN